MGDHLILEDLKAWLNHTARLLEQNSELLSGLDSLIGDGDHGRNICRGFLEVTKNVSAQDASSANDYFRNVSIILADKIGGSCGALLSLFFDGMANASKDTDQFDLSRLSALFRAGLTEIKAMGGAEIGEKTMVDALEPAIIALEGELELIQALESATLSAFEGAEATKGMVAKHGRAKFLGQKSIGLQDPGATSIALIFQALRDSYKEEKSEPKLKD